jgi:hypothetical protein
MLRDVLTQIYERDLDKLRTEIESYEHEADLWKTDGGISNSAGNLALHLTGNLKHFFGAVLGGTGYVRDRDAEFADEGVSREKIISDIEDVRTVVHSTLAKLNEKDFAATYPIEVFGHPMTTEYFLTHLTTHFNYHLGQINYHRRMLSEK